MSTQQIAFTFEGVDYTAPMSFYDTNRCRLPDGRTITAGGWLESMPPRPADLRVTEDDGMPQATRKSTP